jgi:hypothetical protein
MEAEIDHQKFNWPQKTFNIPRLIYKCQRLYFVETKRLT